jgi:two-component system, OmpR family, phosphate regulon sensor histidine kinase PhoR
VTRPRIPSFFFHDHEVFHRLDATRPDGLGLGPFVVRRAVELLGHHMEVRSAVGHGSCFSLLVNAAMIGG